ncbi:hypothetical protein M8C21_032531 [Ambrosia artemisiifolia]|uniref:Uncharacterized protein n=1 Tax=Ambrosia artemisiifolia TaxID=4212 RepID=A0AAD5CSW0_AMBAR|nr:hypothetical protein M8C21_032531 [Ambrosia artemisiifolia]
MDAPKEIFLKDYKLPDYYFDTVDLSFSLGEEKTIVTAKISVVPRVDGAAAPLVLDGVDLKLLSVKINGNELKEGDFHLDTRHLILTSPPSGNFILETVTEILPQKNTSLEGLYKSSGNFCTQCEAEGFRKITFYQDRPDIMAKYTCRIEADKSLYPVLLSNGNLIEQGDLEEFSSDLGSRTVKRIGDVSKLRIYQFSQDAGPMAHPVRPHSYIKMDNFYTVTVYEKGAEVVRMYKTLLGSQGYSQAGTPVVKVTSSYNAEAHTFSLKFSQTVPPTPGQPVKEPMFIPVAAGLLDSNGKDMPLSSIYNDGKLESVACGGQPVTTTVLRVTKGEEEFVFTDVPERPVPSLLRGYSAPIRLHSDLTDDDLFFLLAHDSDEFNRWEAGQILARKLMLSQVVNFQKDSALVLDPQFVHGIKCILLDSSLDKEFIAKAITLPGEGEIMDMMDVADPDAVHAVRKFIRKQLASELKQELINLVKENRSTEKYVFDHANMARRALKNTALGYLASLEDEEITELVLHEYKNATNMTDQFSALAAIAQKPGKARDDALADFYNQWQHDYLVVNKWFALQSSSDIPGNVENVYKLLSHPAFDLKNPNKVYSLIGGFCASPVNFHAKDGSGYKFLGEIVVQLDKLNPQAQLEMIVSANGLSENVYEIASKSLAV